MLQRVLVFGFICFRVYIAGAQPVGEKQPLLLWYTQPAAAWEEALPLGNGRTGAMVFGGVQTERLQLNDNTLWSGYPGTIRMPVNICPL